MSCVHCPHCAKLGGEKGGLFLDGLEGSSNKQTQKEPPKLPVRGKGREYTEAFELAWKEYGRREQKFEAFGVWVIRAREAGGETKLLTLFLAAIKWQRPLFEQSGWQFAPYFERYLKRRKWEDEPTNFTPRATPVAGLPLNGVHDQRCKFHTYPNTRGKLPTRANVDIACPECKHALAAKSTRQSDPRPISDLMPKWAGQPATAEELAELRKASR